MTTPANELTYMNSVGDTNKDYPANKKSWLVRLSKTVLNTDKIMDYARTRPKYFLPSPDKPLFYQPYGTFMDFSQESYLDPKYINQKYPAAGSSYDAGVNVTRNGMNGHNRYNKNNSKNKKLDNLDAYLIRTDLKNQALIRTVLNDFN
jgi:hypothetical protein